MTTHEASGPTWHKDLMEIILSAEDGDEIIVPNPQVLGLALEAVRQVRPDLKVTVTVRENES